MDCARSITKSPLPFPSAGRNRCIIVSDAVLEEMCLHFLWSMRIIHFVEALRYLADRAGVDLPEQEYSEAERRRADEKAVLLEIQQTGSPVLLCTAKEFPGRAGNGISQGKAAWR